MAFIDFLEGIGALGRNLKSYDDFLKHFLAGNKQSAALVQIH